MRPHTCGHKLTRQGSSAYAMALSRTRDKSWSPVNPRLRCQKVRKSLEPWIRGLATPLNQRAESLGTHTICNNNRRVSHFRDTQASRLIPRTAPVGLSLSHLYETAHECERETSYSELVCSLSSIGGAPLDRRTARPAVPGPGRLVGDRRKRSGRSTIVLRRRRISQRAGRA